MVQNFPMRLDHVSYATTHDQISDVVQRIGSQIGTAFVDGGIHPRFGTRNFTAPLVGGQYIEVVCALDHPAAEQTPFGKAVSKKAAEGGGWLSWVLSTKDISKMESRIGRDAVEGHRRRPDGTELKWKQLGIKDVLHNEQLPFFVQWLTTDHPSADGSAKSRIEKIVVAGTRTSVEEWLGGDIESHLGDIDVEFIDVAQNDGELGIVEVILQNHAGVVKIS
jgi:hypothetical protein